MRPTVSMLLPRLGDAREVFVVPDAALHLVNLASLPVGRSQYLVETETLIHYPFYGTRSGARAISPRRGHSGGGQSGF